MSTLAMGQNLSQEAYSGVVIPSSTSMVEEANFASALPDGEQFRPEPAVEDVAEAANPDDSGTIPPQTLRLHSPVVSLPSSEGMESGGPEFESTNDDLPMEPNLDHMLSKGDDVVRSETTVAPDTHDIVVDAEQLETRACENLMPTTSTSPFPRGHAHDRDIIVSSDDDGVGDGDGDDDDARKQGKMQDSKNISDQDWVALLATPEKLRGFKMALIKTKKFLNWEKIAKVQPLGLASPNTGQIMELYGLLVSRHGHIEREETIVHQTVLDTLMYHILLENSSIDKARMAFDNIAARFGIVQSGENKGGVDWSPVLNSSNPVLLQEITSAGCGRYKLHYIAGTLILISQENRMEGRPGLSLEHIRHYGNPTKIFIDIDRYPGAGPWVASCVLGYCLKKPSFPVDRYSKRMFKALGWLPGRVSDYRAHEHMDARIPREIRYELHELMVKHRKGCHFCKYGPGENDMAAKGNCVIQHLYIDTKYLGSTEYDDRF